MPNPGRPRQGPNKPLLGYAVIEDLRLDRDGRSKGKLYDADDAASDNSKV